jgi:hypothetical protein
MTIKEIMDKYGFVEDVELGKMPVNLEEMSKEEREVAETYIKEKMDRVKVMGS